MTMLDLAPVQVRALDHLVCVTCGGSMTAGTEKLTCDRCGTSYAVDSEGIIRVLSSAPERMNLAVRVGQWSWVAALYDRIWRTRAMSLLSGESFPVDREIDIVADTIDVWNGRVFLDNACANGFYARNIARRLRRSGIGGVVFAVDASLPMLRQARRLAQRDGVADMLVFIHADAAALPFADGTFDGIMCGGSLNEFVSPDDVLQELRRVLDPRRGGCSMMFQVRGRRGVKTFFQMLLARVLGLTIWERRDGIEKVRTYFNPEVRYHGGMVLMLSCASRVRTVHDEPVLQFNASAA